MVEFLTAAVLVPVALVPCLVAEGRMAAHRDFVMVLTWTAIILAFPLPVFSLLVWLAALVLALTK